MRCFFSSLIIFLTINFAARSQTLELHYDPRKMVAPHHNDANFPSIYFEYWKGTDSSSTLVKFQADLMDRENNVGKAYLQITRSFKLYRSLQLHLSYSGGLGLTRDRQYSYAIGNVFSAGIARPFKWKDAVFTAVLDMRLMPTRRVAIDPLFTLYWYKPFFNYKIQLLGDFSIWTSSRTGADGVLNLKNKQCSFFAEPQVWIKIRNNLAAGSRLNMYYHVLSAGNKFDFYPTIGIKSKL